MTVPVSEQHKPIAIQLHSRSRQLELEYEGGERYSLSCEYLRVHSPSAEVLGHGPHRHRVKVRAAEIVFEKRPAPHRHAPLFGVAECRAAIDRLVVDTILEAARRPRTAASRATPPSS